MKPDKAEDIFLSYWLQNSWSQWNQTRRRTFAWVTDCKTAKVNETRQGGGHLPELLTAKQLKSMKPDKAEDARRTNLRFLPELPPVACKGHAKDVAEDKPQTFVLCTRGGRPRPDLRMSSDCPPHACGRRIQSNRVWFFRVKEQRQLC